MKTLQEEIVKAYCTSCGNEQTFSYVNLESIRENLVYWECDCIICGKVKSGLSEIGFNNL